MQISRNRGGGIYFICVLCFNINISFTVYYCGSSYCCTETIKAQNILVKKKVLHIFSNLVDIGSADKCVVANNR